MKKLLLVLLIVAMICAGTACGVERSNTPENSEPPTSEVSEKSVFHTYDDILKRYQDLLFDNDKTATADPVYADPNDGAIEEALQTTVINSDTGMMGYAIYDSNGDGQTELFLMDEDYHIYAAFSQKNDHPVLLDLFMVNNHCVALDQNGNFYQTGYGKGEHAFYTKIMRMASGGDWEVLLEYGCSDDGIDGSYYVIENHVKRTTDLQEITTLQEQYDAFLQNPSETTKSSGLCFIPVM